MSKNDLVPGSHKHFGLFSTLADTYDPSPSFILYKRLHSLFFLAPVPEFYRQMNETWFFPIVLFQCSWFNDLDSFCIHCTTILLFTWKLWANCACEINRKAKEVDPEGSKINQEIFWVWAFFASFCFSLLTIWEQMGLQVHAKKKQ